MFDFERNGIEKMERTVNDVEEFINKTLKPMDIIDEPEAAMFVKICFDMTDGYLRHEKEMMDRLDNIITRLDKIEEKVSRLEKESR